MQWQEVINDETLQNLPYKIELNQKGNIEMSPASNRHGFLQSRIEKLLWKSLEGETFPECSISTSKGVKVADVVWCSTSFLKNHGFETPYSKAPELCIEVISPSNTTVEITDKIELYLEAGAQEVWIISEEGSIQFYDNSGINLKSKFNIIIDKDIFALQLN